MMRKDVRIGFAIGSVLLAVLIVYGLVTSGPTNNEVTLVPDSDTPAAENPAGAADRRAAALPAVNPPAAAPTGNTMPPGNPPNGDAAAPVAQNNNASTPSAAEPSGASSGGTVADRWEHALTRGELPPVLMTQAPTAADAARTADQSTNEAPGGASAADAGESAAPSPARGSTDATPPAESQATSPDSAEAAPTGPSIYPSNGASGTGAGQAGFDARELTSLASAPATQPTGSAADSGNVRTHVVQPNETFSSIAAVAYGSESYYPHLLRANPNVDPKKLRAGMTIVLPPREQVVARSTPAPGEATAASAIMPIDETKEYRVQDSDSLYKISLKLYGRADKVEAIYQLNKEAIGPNPSRLKSGLVLQLPEPPTRSPETAAR